MNRLFPVSTQTLCLSCWVIGVLCICVMPIHQVAVVLGAILLLGILLRVSGRLILLGMVALLLGCGYGVWRIHQAVESQWQSVHQEPSELMVTVISPSEQYDQYVLISVLARSAAGDIFRLRLSDYQKREWLVGTRWTIHVRVRPIVASANRVGFDREAWALVNGIQGMGSVGRVRHQLPDETGMVIRWQRWRENLNQYWTVAENQYPLGVSLMRALSLGNRMGFSDNDWQAFRVLGINHLVSISGLHIGLVALLAAGFFKGVFRLLPITIYEPRKWFIAIGLLAATSYAALAGFSIPTQRAILMLFVFSIAWWGRWRISHWQAWLVSAVLVLFINPMSTLSVGFWLSFGLVATLILATEWLPRKQSGYQKFFQMIQIQCVIAIVSAVLSGYFFGSIPLLSLPVNLLAIPWFSLFLVPLSLLVLLFPYPWFIQCIAAIGQQTMLVILWVATDAPIRHLPHLPLSLWLIALLGLIIYALPKVLSWRPLAILSITIIFVFRQPEIPIGTARVDVWDVEQGLSVLVRTHQHSLLFDTGTRYATQSQVIPNIQALGIQQLSALVVSHYDNDHDGGTNMILQSFTPNLFLAGQPEFYPHAQWCSGGMSWDWNHVRFEWLTLSEHADNDNQHSCVLRILAGNKSVLIMGDLDAAGEQKLIQKYGSHLHSQVLILGHHGSKTASSKAFLDTVLPEKAIVSSGFANRYHHPHPEVVQRLSDLSISLYRTDWQGGVSFDLADGKPITWQPLRKEPLFWQRKRIDWTGKLE